MSKLPRKAAPKRRRITPETAVIAGLKHPIREHLERVENLIVEKYAHLSTQIEELSTKLRDNGDTSPEQVQEYLNKIGRMIASGRYTPASQFLKNVFKSIESSGHITKRQMAAVDRIEARPRQEASASDPWYLGDVSADDFGGDFD